jgi:hypothetical protein
LSTTFENPTEVTVGSPILIESDTSGDVPCVPLESTAFEAEKHATVCVPTPDTGICIVLVAAH